MTKGTALQGGYLVENCVHIDEQVIGRALGSERLCALREGVHEPIAEPRDAREAALNRQMKHDASSAQPLLQSH